MRKLLILASLVIISITASGQMMLPGVVASSRLKSTLTNGLYGHWKFENNAEDSFGAYDGTATNVTYVAGKSGNAASFNGSTSKVVIGNVIKPTTAMSFSVWIKDGGQSAEKHVISHTIYDGAWKGWRFTRYSDNAAGVLITDGIGNFLDVAFGSTYSNDVWHHVVFTWNGTTAYVYQDGTKNSGWTFTPDIGYGTTHNLTFGANDSGAQVYDGEIDELRIYNRALTDAEANELYHEFD